MKRWLLSGAIFLFSIQVQAEYRAFMLQLVNTKTNTTRQFLSTLDPDQYRTLYPISSDESLTYVQTWRCYGRTSDFIPICAKPDKKPARTPSQSPEN